MEERYPGFDAAPLSPDEGDIARAASEAADQAAGHGTGPGDGAVSPGPRRWLVVTGAAVSVLALAGTATALAVRKPPHSDVAGTVAATSAATSATTDATQDVTDSASDLPTSDSPTTLATTTAPPTTTTTTRKKPTPPTTTTPTAKAPAGSNETDCENTSHETPADAAMAFSGMQKGAQLAFLAAQTDAKAAGMQFVLNSGYRSAAYQQRVYDCWVQELGSPEAARQYALPPSESAHVKGYAMDIAPPSAAAWLQASAGKYGLCRRYADETWHFEYQASYKTDGCPALLPHP
jgi:LAS superfamily LD-carboxypeptidase LdcB